MQTTDRQSTLCHSVILQQQHKYPHWKPVGERAFAAVVILTLALVFGPVKTATAQTPSDADTLRVLNQIGLPGDTISIDIYVRSSIVLGGFNFRIRYDSSQIVPVERLAGIPSYEQLDPMAFGKIWAFVSADSLVIFTCIEEPIEPPFFTPRGAVAIRILWLIQENAVDSFTVLAFANDPVYPQSWNTMTDLSTMIFLRPVLTAGQVRIIDSSSCSCSALGDIDGNGWLDTLDLAALIDFVFMGGPAPPYDASCPFSHRGELTCDSATDMLDVTLLADLIFQGGPSPCVPCMR